MQHRSLTVNISSFSYKKNTPMSDTAHGCGFVFDLRAIENPGRLEAYKYLSGRDKAVAEYLLNNSEIKNYLEHCRALIDMTISCYLERNFELLNINFGCTGGQHRSVFAAENTAAYLIKKYAIGVNVVHQNQDNWLLK